MYPWIKVGTNGSRSSGERRVASGERRVASGERRAASGERRAASGERRAASGERRAASGEWRVASGEWRAASGERWVTRPFRASWNRLSENTRGELRWKQQRKRSTGPTLAFSCVLVVGECVGWQGPGRGRGRTGPVMHETRASIHGRKSHIHHTRRSAHGLGTLPETAALDGTTARGPHTSPSGCTPITLPSPTTPAPTAPAPALSSPLNRPTPPPHISDTHVSDVHDESPGSAPVSHRAARSLPPRCGPTRNRTRKTSTVRIAHPEDD